MRFGLVGTGPWAHKVHGPALAGSAAVDLVGVWGRSPDKVGALAADLGVVGYDDLDRLLEQVDAVAFAVPPEVQVDLATRAARAGKHLLLDKPVATDPDRARELAAAVETAGVSALVFFTDQFSPSGSAWFVEVVGQEWLGGAVTWLSSLDTPGNPYGASAWRREQGALWDIGPHALATLVAALGPVTDLVAVAGARDLVHLVMTHDSGASSTATMSLFAPPAASTHQTRIWGQAGTTELPARVVGEDVAGLDRAARALVSVVESGSTHPCDLRLGVRISELLAEASRQLGR